PFPTRRSSDLASRVGLARRLVDLTAVAIALGGAGFVLAFAHAAPSVATAYGLDGTIVLVVGCGLLVARDGRIQISAALGGAATGAPALAGSHGPTPAARGS